MGRLAPGGSGDALACAAMVFVALTGGIGSGKSTVAAMLVQRGAVLIDADALAREVVEPGQPIETRHFLPSAARDAKP